MPKPKLTELPKLEEWKAPWEVDAAGEDIPEDEQKLDPARLKKYLYGLLNDKINIRKSLDETTARAEELEAEVEKATDPKQLEKVQGDLAKARQERDEAKQQAAAGANALKWEIALEKGLTKTQAKRLVGSTREELETDADELLAEFGQNGKSGEGEGEKPGGDVRRAPRRNLQNAGDPDPDAGREDEDEIDPDKVVSAWLASR